VREVVGGDTLAFVGDDQLGSPIPAREPDVDDRASRAVLDGVVEDDEQDLFHPARVHTDGEIGWRLVE
jgi:hypothetical protein